MEGGHKSTGMRMAYTKKITQGNDDVPALLGNKIFSFYCDRNVFNAAYI